MIRFILQIVFLITSFNVLNSEAKILWPKDGPSPNQGRENVLKSLNKKNLLPIGNGDEKFLFQDNTIGSAINSFISFTANVFSIWSWIETRDDQKDKKEPSSSEIVVEELGEQIQDLNSLMEHKLKEAVQQVTCRLDAIYLKGNTIRPECLQFIKPNRIESASAKPAEWIKKKHDPFQLGPKKQDNRF